MDEETQRAFEAGEPMLLYMRGGEVRWRRLVRDWTGTLEMHFSQGTPDEIRTTDVERVGATGEVDLREG